MNLNILTYLIYSIITGFIILRVGWLFYHFGAAYLYEIFGERRSLADAVNKLLLIGYYLLNLGYVAVSLSFWPQVHHLTQMLELLSAKVGFICLALGLIHFLNMLWVRLLKKQILNLNIS